MNPQKHTSLISLAGAVVTVLISASQPSFAIQFDLVNNSSQSVPGLNGHVAIFDKTSQQPTGSGVIDPFLRIHDNDNFEQGFNTSAAGNPPDGLNAINGVFTHDLLLSSLKITDRNGSGSYFQFLLDLGEPGNEAAADADNELLLLQKFNLYTGDNDAPTFAEIGGNPDNLGTKRFDLAGNTIMLFDENHGNGQADVLIYVPTAAFNGVTDKYLYLYAEFGLDHGGSPLDGDAEGTFEEFAALTGENVTVPDGGSTIMLLGAALSSLAAFKRSRRTV